MVLSFVATNIQLGLVLQAAVVMTALKLSAALSTCDRAMKAGLLRRKINCEVLMKLRGIEISETVRGLLYCIGLAEVTWKTLSVLSLVLSNIRHVGRDVDQTNNHRVRSRFGDYSAAITVSHKNAWSIL